MVSQMILTIFEFAGVFILPLFGCSIIAVSLLIERLVFWIRFPMSALIQVSSLGTLNSLSDFLPTAKQLFVDYHELSYKRVSKNSLAEFKVKADLLQAQLIKRVSKSHQVLLILVTISPLLGILGTILGIVFSFQHVTEMSNPNLLTSGVSQALLSTLFGLGIAVISYLIYSISCLKVEKVNFYFTQFMSRVEILLIKQSENKEN